MNALLNDPLRLAAMAGLGCAAALAAAFFFQFVVGLAPCPLCIWGRWPHVAGMAAGALAFALGSGRLAALGVAAMAAGVLIAAYHVGVEQGFWESAVCATGSDIGGLTPEELLARIREAPLVRCDEVAWSLLGLSMAAWNGLLSLGLAAVFAVAALGGLGETMRRLR